MCEPSISALVPRGLSTLRLAVCFRFTPRSNAGLAISYGPHMATAFLAFTANVIVFWSEKFFPGDIGHWFNLGKSRLPKPSNTHKCGLVRKSAGSQLMLEASNSQFLYFRVGRNSLLDTISNPKSAVSVCKNEPLFARTSDAQSKFRNFAIYPGKFGSI